MNESDAIPAADAFNTVPPLPHRFSPDSDALFRHVGGGIAVLVTVPEAEALRWGNNGGIAAWLHVADTGVATFYCGKVEVGQNIRTSLAQVVADELRLPLSEVRTVLGDTALTPFEPGTFGSRTTPIMVPQARCCAAAARELLLYLAAQVWDTDRAALIAEAGGVIDAAHARRIGYGALVRGQRLVRTVAQSDIPTTPAERWTVTGAAALKADGRAFVAGTHSYPSDIRRDGMRYGKVLRAPAYGATLRSLDASEAAALPGVTVVRDGDFVGVVAPSIRTANRALTLVRAEWNPAPPLPDDADLFGYLRRTGAPVEHDSVPAAPPEPMLRATYTVAYIAHAPLEPRAAVAEWADGGVTVWTGTQKPFGVREELQRALDLPEERVRVIVPDTGSGYGGKHTGEAAIEAARLARAAGVPVKMVWTREEEFTWAYFRPAGVIEVAGAANAAGDLTAWRFDNYNSGGAGLGMPYAVPDPLVAFHECPSPLRQGSYRALASTANHFARESHLDDLAHAIGMDPLAFRLRNLPNDRQRAVLEAAAERFGWGAREAVPPGHGFGIAGGTEKGSYVANCVEVRVDPATGALAVLRIVVAYECGAILNPLHLENQVEGAIVMGLGGALFETIHFANGTITNPRFSEYRVPRFADVPPIEIVLLDRKDLPAVGAGETPLIALAPAIGNAYFQATGKRLRTLPLNPLADGC